MSLFYTIILLNILLLYYYMMWGGTVGIFFGNILVSYSVLVKNAKGQKRAKKQCFGL